MKYYLAIDLGASSGRHIVGWQEQGEVRTQEVYRFPNGLEKEHGHLVWNMEQLLYQVKKGIALAKTSFPDIESLSIDSWGVDYVLMQADRELLPCYAYRDSRTEPRIAQVHEKLPFSQLYSRSGCQFQPFNSIYQLFDDLQQGRLEMADDFLMIPEYLLYKLGGRRVHEYTNATTTGLVNAKTGQFDRQIIQSLGLPSRLFPALTQPGALIGEYEGIKLRLCASHDTASAVHGIPMDGNQPYIVSGTWSLLGVKTPSALTDSSSMAANYSNEGGVGYNRYQKNIMGMWLIQELRKELCPQADFGELVQAAQESDFDGIIDVDSPSFLAPESMSRAFDQALGERVGCVGDYIRCACRSLALGYKRSVDELERNTGKRYSRLYIVGGGAKNHYLNELTREALGKEIIPLPIEASALGNLKIQMEETENELH